MRPIDADKLGLTDIEIMMCNGSYKTALEMLLSKVNMQPAIDAVPVIRCKDCKYFFDSSEKCEIVDTRLHFYETDKKWTGESFCSWAERKEE